MSNWIIFTDLDGTLLDHHDYSFTSARPALQKIEQLNIPLIINSSKTRAEIQSIRQQMHNHCAFAVENGAAVFLPENQLSGKDTILEPVILGTAQTEILKVLNNLRAQHQFLFKGFSDFSIKDLMDETGLSKTQAAQAKQRLASEPIKWLDTQDKLKLFKQQLAHHNLQLIQGGRFHHVMGYNDKSLAMAWLLNKYNQKHNLKTIAFGDSQNDLKMLKQADYAVVIRKHDGSYLQLDRNPEQVYLSKNTAPLGWQEVMDQLFSELQIGKINE